MICEGVIERRARKAEGICYEKCKNCGCACREKTRGGARKARRAGAEP
jgi:hypothetical protein